MQAEGCTLRAAGLAVRRCDVASAAARAEGWLVPSNCRSRLWAALLPAASLPWEGGTPRGRTGDPLSCTTLLLPPPQALVVTQDGRQLLTGGERGSPCLRWTAILALAHRFAPQPHPQAGAGGGDAAGPAVQAAITSLALAADEACFVAGTAAGGCLLYCCQEGGLYRRTGSGSNLRGSGGGLGTGRPVNLASLGSL